MTGVLGVVPGIMGLLQANEVLKILLGIGDTLAGRLVLFDALDATFTELRLRRDPDCPVCSDAAVAARAVGQPLPIPILNWTQRVIYPVYKGSLFVCPGCSIRYLIWWNGNWPTHFN